MHPDLLTVKTLNDVVVEQTIIVLFVELLVFSFVLPCLSNGQISDIVIQEL